MYDLPATNIIAVKADIANVLSREPASLQYQVNLFLKHIILSNRSSMNCL